MIVGRRILMTDIGVVQIVRIREEKRLAGREEGVELHLWWRWRAWLGGGGVGEDGDEGSLLVRLISIHIIVKTNETAFGLERWVVKSHLTHLYLTQLITLDPPKYFDKMYGFGVII